MVVPIVQQKIICYNLNYVYLSLVFAPHRSRTSLDKEYIKKSLSFQIPL